MAQGMNLSTKIEAVPSVGPKRAALFRRLGVESVCDLLRLVPREYLDLRDPLPCAAAPLGQVAALRGTVLSAARGVRLRPGMEVYKTTARDASGIFDLVFFNTRFTALSLKPGETVIFYGKVTGSPLRRELVNPLVVRGEGQILPVYPLTAGLNQYAVRRAIAKALEDLTEFDEVLPPALCARRSLCSRAQAYRMLHQPKSPEEVEQARRRLAFEELLIFSLRLSLLRRGERAQTPVRVKPVPMEPFFRSLPFPLTGAQKRVIEEILSDYRQSTVQNRLIQGDVGSGKTVCAAAAVYALFQNGYQSAMMAPTEVLAAQHLSTMTRFLTPFGVRCALLTGSTHAPERREILQKLAAGEIDLLIGTHAIFGERVEFARLGLVITDEQHRFGVRQRQALSQKGEGAHVLVMSATPIPRTLALILYAELDVSQLDELPPGRTPTATYVVTPELRERLYGFVRKHVLAGEQAYVVCPKAEESETGEVADVKTLCRELSEGPLRGLSCDILYGKMGARRKQDVLDRFYRGELSVLVATTVVEVGLDVPRATGIVVENAERFGLSQLHQLRGRVGRGKLPGYCILISPREDNERLSAMKKTTDGFALAREDLRQRGPGEFFGQRQSGEVRFAIADLMTDMDVLTAARAEADAILAADPDLSLPAHRGLHRAAAAPSGQLANL